MIPRLSTLSTLLFGASVLDHALAHMELSQPYPLRSRLNPANTGANVDYNLKSPLNADGSNFPCRGYHNDSPLQVTATYKAGQSYEMSITDTVTHGGGSCQLSLSYDNGATFKVIKSIIGNCPIKMSYDFTIPSYAPSGNAIFSWTWFNEIGNREMYQNCAWVTIQGSSAARRMKRQNQFTSMDSLPNIWRANIAGLNNCSTTEGVDPHFANLGPDVEYGPGKSVSDPVTLPNANCDAAAPPGQLFKSAASSGSGPVTTAGTAQLADPAAAATNAPNAPNATSPAAVSATTATPSAGVFAEEPAGSSTTAEAVPTITTASLVSSTTPVAPPTSFVTEAVPVPSPGTPSFAALDNANQYLPCVPGAFICLSPTQFLICDQEDSGVPSQPGTKLVGPLAVADGMQCLPYYAQLPVGSSLAVGSTGGAPGGYFRSDRYVRT
jgi:hypothetical protein